MANFGDIYSYRIDVNATGVSDAQQLAATMSKVGADIDAASRKASASSVQWAHMQASLGEIEYQARRTADAIETMGMRSAPAMAGGARQASTSLEALSTAMIFAGGAIDDLQYGSKNVANNFLYLAAVAPHPALKMVAVAAGLGVSAFHKQIDAALGLGNAFEKVGKDADGAAAKIQTFADRIAQQLKVEAGAVQAVGSDFAKTVDELSREDEEGLFGALVGTKGADQRIAILREKVAEAEAMKDRLGFFQRRRVEQSISATYDEINRLRKENEASTRAELDKLIADAARGEAGARARLEDLARKAGIDTLVEALQKLTPQFAQAEAAAAKFVQRQKDMAEAEKEVRKLGGEWLKGKIRDLEEWAKRRQEANAKEVEEERAKLEALDKLRQQEWERRQGVNANAFRQRLAPGITSTIFAAMGRGATAEQAEGLAINQAAGVMQNAGMNGMQAVSTAMKLVQEQMEWVQQQNANMDALLGLMVGQFRANTMGRRQAAAQANRIRQMQLMQNAQNPFLNNRPDGL